MRYAGSFCCVLLLLVMTGCSVRLRNVPPDKSLAYIYLDLTEADVVPTWVTVKQISPSINKPYYYCGFIRDKNNKHAAVFWYDSLAPGTYQMSQFGGEGRLLLQRTQIEFMMPETGRNETAIVISRPGTYFMGAYKYRALSSTWAGFVGKGKFALEPLATPSRVDALKELQPLAAGSSWEARINSELASEQ